MSARKRRYLLVAIGEPGHAFPVIALGRELASRGHTVAIHTWDNWREHIEAAGAELIRAPRFDLDDPGAELPTMHEAAARGALEMLPALREFAPDVVVADVLSVAGSLAAEIAGVPFATLIPHLYPVTEPEDPPFGSGLAPARTPVARAAYRALYKPSYRLMLSGKRHLDEARAELGLPLIDRLHGGLSDELVLVGTLPQLEPLRRRPRHVQVVGPLQWEPPSEPTPVPEGDGPLVVVAPSTAQDPYHRLLRTALRGLAGRPVRVLGTTNGRPLPRPPAPAPNLHVVDWLTYSSAFPQADVVVTHGGHGTLMRILTAGTIPVVCPHNGDQFENAARLRWAKAGVCLPAPFLRPATIALAVEKALASPALRAKAQQLAEWSARNHGPARAADLLEQFAGW